MTMQIKIGQRYKYKSYSNSYQFIGEVTLVDNREDYMTVKIVSIMKFPCNVTMGNVFTAQPITSWEYLPGQDAP